MTVKCYNNAMEQKRYTIEDLCELTGFSRRTIRYYIQEGLLEPPAGRGRGGFYFDSHLEKLQEMRALQQRGRSLKDIKKELFREGREPDVSYADTEVWVKYPISEGIEFHISSELEKKEAKKIAEIIRVTRSILEGGDKE